jgi:hypothetical protein
MLFIDSVLDFLAAVSSSALVGFIFLEFSSIFFAFFSARSCAVLYLSPFVFFKFSYFSLVLRSSSNTSETPFKAITVSFWVLACQLNWMIFELQFL